MCRLPLTLLLLASLPSWAERPRIQVALLLDTSNSMDGLIDQARAQLWSFINHFAPMKRKGETPELQVALYEYGNTNLSRAEGYVRQVLPLTMDLDKVSEQLFALRTQGGDEYCGAVITRAVQDLAWSTSRADLKVIFIAGNEPFDQGPVNFRRGCGLASARDITLHTIFCGPEGEGVATHWAEGAKVGGGSYLSIDPNQQEAAIPAPQDADMARLGTQLNTTYIPIGPKGQEAQKNQVAQDAHAQRMAPGVTQARTSAKASAFYRADDWDLVDAEKAGSVALKTLDKKQLPLELQGKDQAELRAYVDAKAKERSELQARIRKLSAEREAYLLAQRKEQTGSARTLNSAMIQALSGLAKVKGFQAQ